jgi:transposase
MGSGGLGGVEDVEFWRAEAERLAADNAVLQARVAELEDQLGALAEKVSVLARLAFGRSSEKAAAKPASGQDDPADEAAGGSEGRGRGQRRGSRGHGRRDYSDLPAREEIHDVPEAERFCPRCGAGYVPFGEECCEQIDWQVQLVRIVHRRPSYRRSCRCAGVRGVLVAPPVPKAIAKGRFTTGFLARLLTEKFVLGRPAHRIVAALAHDGFSLPEGTLAGVFAACSALLAPLATAISARNAASAHLHVDETSWKVYAAVEGKDTHRWWCWVFAGPDTTVFRIAPSRSLSVLAEQLGIEIDDTDPEALPEGRHLLLSSDFYTVYQSLGHLEGISNLWCWAHMRRYFLRAGQAHPELAAWSADWVERIAALYVAHSAMAAATPGSSAHTWASAQFSAALNTIDADRATKSAHPELLHPAAAKVLATLDREWEGLARHREFPQLPLDNNTAERALRGPVIGRKNYYGSGSVVSAELASHAWTITATAQQAGLNPLTYLSAYLDTCAHNSATAPQGPALTRFLPWMATTDDLTTWAHHPQPTTNTTEPDTTGSTTASQGAPGTGPAP